MTERIKFQQYKEGPNGGFAPEGGGMSFEEMVAALYRVLRKHPEARADVEEAFNEMAKRKLENEDRR